MGVKNVVRRIGQKGADKISDLAVLSSKQVEEIQKKREDFLLEKPDPSDELSLNYTSKMMAASSVEIFNSYLKQIKELYYPITKEAEYSINDKENSFDIGHNIRYFKITKWVTDKNENSIEKLINVYAVLADEYCNIALVFDRKIDKTDVYLAVVNLNNANNSTDVASYKDRLLEAIKGNFPGSTCKDNDDEDFKFGKGIIPCLDNDKLYSVATASTIPAEKSEKFISQTIEKLIDGIVPDEKKKEYILILLATPIHDVEERKLRLGEFHSGLTPYSSWQTNYTNTETSGQSSSATMGVNIGASAGIQNSKNYGDTKTTGDTSSKGNSESDSHTSSVYDGQGTTSTNSTSTTNTSTDDISNSVSGSVSAKVAGSGVTVSNTYGTSHSDSLGVTEGASLATSATRSVSDAVGKSVSNTIGKAVTKSLAATNNIGSAVNFGGNVGANFSRSSTMMALIGKNEGITQTFINYNIKHAIELLESQMKRLEQSTALGMWDFAAYVLSDNRDVANNVAHTYLALSLGEESYLSKSAINIWHGNLGENNSESRSAKEIVKYLRELRHPLFALKTDIVTEDPTYNVYPAVVNATTNLSGKELAYSLNFPQKSIAGLPVIKCAEFGRNITYYNEKKLDEKKIKLGNIFHMNNVEKTNVDLSLESLTSHTFITGSTGSGKSNTIYKMLFELRKNNVKFLVIEPAKGEYKNIFGNDEDVNVFGTNPNLSDLLRLDPFKFPSNIHVLEHLDRLIEIFNVCWPMYAAMPAVLKNAIEKSYVECGWNLIKSINEYGENIYPTFKDVAKNIKEIINSSEYDDENKGAYKGSLLTRLSSLTTGINGLIFSSNDLSDKILFDENTIIDLSRVGSSETKSLIMGILILKLQEYRMSSQNKMNQNLKHVTVLEEAHNILKRTSTEQSTESSNLIGKSVEMLSNAIAEMRTYGEGFIIADQAPGLMDMSVIRNTNTKIILRLPDQSDRELVGKAANLNNDQIVELAKIPCGVATIYQNEWIMPVLCKIERFNFFKGEYQYNEKQFDILTEEDNKIKESLLDCIMNNEINNTNRCEYIKKIKKQIIESRLDTSVKCDVIKLIESNDDTYFDNLKTLVYEFLTAQRAIEDVKTYNDIQDWVRNVVDNLQPQIKGYSNKQIDLAMALILYEQYERDNSYMDIYVRFTELYSEKGGVF